jgi:hypothetical protein
MNDTNAPQTHRHSLHTGDHSSGHGRHLLARWPSVVGLVALLANAAGGLDAHVTAMIIILAAMCYVAAAALGSRRSGWWVLAGGVLAVVVASLTGLDRTTALLVLGAGFVVFGLLRGSGVDRRELVVQTLGFAGFSLLALTAMTVEPVLAVYLAAAASLGHAGWDLFHFLRQRAVARSFSEFCSVLDLGLGLVLLLTAWGVLGL